MLIGDTKFFYLFWKLINTQTALMESKFCWKLNTHGKLNAQIFQNSFINLLETQTALNGFVYWLET